MGDVSDVEGGRQRSMSGAAVVSTPRRLLRPSKHVQSWTKCIVVKNGPTFRMFRESSKSFVLSAVRIHGTSLVLISAQQDFPTVWHTPSVARDDVALQHAPSQGSAAPSEAQGGHRQTCTKSVASTSSLPADAAAGGAWGSVGRPGGEPMLPPQQPGAQYCAVVLPTHAKPLLAPNGRVMGDSALPVAAQPTGTGQGGGGSGRSLEHHHPEVLHYSPSKLKYGGMQQGTVAWFALHLVGMCENCDDRAGEGSCTARREAAPRAAASAPARTTAATASTTGNNQPVRRAGGGVTGALGALAKGIADKLRPGGGRGSAGGAGISPAKVAPMEQDDAEAAAALEEGRMVQSSPAVPAELQGRLGTSAATAEQLQGQGTHSPAPGSGHTRVRLRQCLGAVAQFVQYLRGPDVDVRCLAVHLPRVLPDGVRVVWCPRVPRPLWLGFTPRDLRDHAVAQGLLRVSASRSGSAPRRLDAVGALLSATLSASAEEGWSEEANIWHKLCHLLADYTARPEARSLPVFTSVHTQPWRLQAVLQWEDAQAQLLAHKLNKPLRKRIPDASKRVESTVTSGPSSPASGTVPLKSPAGVSATLSLGAPAATSLELQPQSSLEALSKVAVNSTVSVPLSAPPTQRVAPSSKTAAAVAARRTGRASSIGSAAGGSVGSAPGGDIHGEHSRAAVHSGPPVAGMGPPGGAGGGALTLPVASPASLRAFSWASDNSEATSVLSGASFEGRGGGGGGGSRVKPSVNMTAAQRVRLKRLTLGFSGSSEARSVSHTGSLAYGSSMGSVDSEGWGSEDDEGRFAIGTRDTSLNSEGGAGLGGDLGGTGPRESSLDWKREQEEEVDAVFELSDSGLGGPSAPFTAARDEERGLSTVPSALSIIAEVEDTTVHRGASGSTWEAAGRLGRAAPSEEVGDTAVLRVLTANGHRAEATAGAADQGTKPTDLANDGTDSDGMEAVGQTTDSIFQALNAALSDMEREGSADKAPAQQSIQVHVQPLRFESPAGPAVDQAPGHGNRQHNSQQQAQASGSGEGPPGNSSVGSEETEAEAAAAEESDVPVPVPSYQYEWGCDPVPLDSMLLMNRLPEWNSAAKTLSMKFLGARVTGSSSRNFLLEAVQGGGGSHVAAAAAAASRQPAKARPSAYAEAALLAEVDGGSAAQGTAPDPTHCGGLPERAIRAPSTPCLQFGRMKGNTYSLDYRHPMSAMQAFGVFLSAFMWGVSPSTAGAAGKGPPVLQTTAAVSVAVSS